MSDYGGAPSHEVAHGSAHEVSPISVPWVVLASVICGIGITLMWQFVTTFNFLYFLGAPLILVGALMFLNERAGLDHA
jgi:hypothetical protein